MRRSYWPHMYNLLSISSVDYTLLMTQKRDISTKVTKRYSSTVKFVTMTCTVYIARKSYYATVGALIQLCYDTVLYDTVQYIVISYLLVRLFSIAWYQLLLFVFNLCSHPVCRVWSDFTACLLAHLACMCLAKL